MAALISTGSPKMSRRSTPSSQLVGNDPGRASVVSNATKVPNPNTVLEQSQEPSVVIEPQATVQTASETPPTNEMRDILTRLRINDSRMPDATKPELPGHYASDNLDKIINNFSSQHKTLRRQELDVKGISGYDSSKCSASTSGSEEQNPNEGIAKGKNPSKGYVDVTPMTGEGEMLRMRQELERAKNIINQQERELSESRNLQHTMEQAIGPPSEADFPLLPDGRISSDHMQSAFNAAARPFTSRRDSPWVLTEDARLDGGAMPTARFSRVQPPFNGPAQAFGHDASSTFVAPVGHPNSRLAAFNQPGNFNGVVPNLDMAISSNHAMAESSNHGFGIDQRALRGLSTGTQLPPLSRPTGQMRSNSTYSDPLSPVMHGSVSVAPLGGQGQYGFSERPYNGPLSPLSPDFPPMAAQSLVPTAGMNSQTYVTPLEPMNYRRLLDKSVSCDWKYIVDKIVCNNDQQASIFLQQKLKVGTAEQKYEIVESIVNQAYPLMINRFGNFLVQRCFEHGTPDQVIAIANAIHGNVISLSMDPFGCHVIQKAFDSIPEDHKADMVRELLRRIPDTVIHRYACHVWQKLFELRWSGEPPQIMLKVNEALRGMWHEVALGETGSLVVQNIFENCVEEEKRPAIEEVIANIDLIAHGQFGNWCIQHLCEHGSPPDKRRVIDHILINSYNYSIDQFASKVVEKCLKIGGTEFLDRYLTVITTARPDRPRIPLIDIAGDQYGNYLIQWILMNTHHQQREQVAVHIRKHMVSLRGSKFGSRVAMLCSNPAAATRPGPPQALVNMYGTPGQPARNTAWPRYR